MPTIHAWASTPLARGVDRRYPSCHSHHMNACSHTLNNLSTSADAEEEIGNRMSFVYTQPLVYVMGQRQDYSTEPQRTQFQILAVHAWNVTRLQRGADRRCPSWHAHHMNACSNTLNNWSTSGDVEKDKISTSQ